MCTCRDHDRSAGTSTSYLYAVQNMFLIDGFDKEWKPFMDSRRFPQTVRLLKGCKKSRLQPKGGKREKMPIPDDYFGKMLDCFDKPAFSHGGVQVCLGWAPRLSLLFVL